MGSALRRREVCSALRCGQPRRWTAWTACVPEALEEDYMVAALATEQEERDREPVGEHSRSQVAERVCVSNVGVLFCLPCRA